MTKKTLLFVDDDPEYLGLLKETLRGSEPNWTVVCAGSGDAAVTELEKQTFDAVVADYQMPEMDGAQFLEKTQEIQPSAVRLLISGCLSEEDVIRLALPVHQCFSKPLDMERFRRTVRRIGALRDLLASDVLKRLVAQCSQIPTIPTLYLELAKELKSPTTTLESIENVIRKDPAVAAKILQLVNSGFFALGRRVESLVDAINFVGVQIIKALTLTLPVFSRFDGIRIQDYSPSAIWEHCWRTAILARRIAEEEGQSRAGAEEAFIAGLLHDLGKIVLAANLPALCRETSVLMTKQKISMHEAERQIFGCDHAMIGAYLLGLWGIDEPVVEAAAFHNQPLEAPSNRFGTLAAVHVANALDHAFREAQPDRFKDNLDLEYVMSIGMAARIEPWQKAGIAVFQQSKEASGQ